MVDIQTISIAIASGSVVLAAIYYVLQIRHQTKIRETDLIMRLYLVYGNEEYTKATIRYLAAEYKDYNDFMEKYPAGAEDPVQVAFRMIPMIYEGAGLLLYRKLVSPDLMYELLAAGLFWEKFKPFAEGVRKRYNEPGLFCWFEYLANEMKKRGKTATALPTERR